MKVLLVALEWPFPPQNGGAIATASMVTALASSTDLTIYALDSDANGVVEAVPGGSVRRYGHSCRRPRNLANFLRSLLRNLPLAPFRNWHPTAQGWLDLHAQEFDLLVFDHLIPMVYYRKTMPPAILVEQNAEFSLWERAADVHARWYLRPLLSFEAARMRAFEQQACRASRTVVALTPEDAALLSPLAASTPVEVIPPCILSDPLQGLTPPSPPPGKRFLFVGTLSWEPNSDGLLWFTREIWPQILLRHPDATLDVVGRGLSAAAHAKLAQVPGLHLHGFQEHLAPFYAKARIIVAPLRFGSGFKLKVLEAMAFGVPVLTTPVGAEGFATGTDFPLQICSDNSEWHVQVDKLISNDVEWSNQSGVQLAGVKDHYSLASRSLKFEALIRKVCARPAAPVDSTP